MNVHIPHFIRNFGCNTVVNLHPVLPWMDIRDGFWKQWQRSMNNSKNLKSSSITLAGLTVDDFENLSNILQNFRFSKSTSGGPETVQWVFSKTFTSPEEVQLGMMTLVSFQAVQQRSIYISEADTRSQLPSPLEEPGQYLRSSYIQRFGQCIEAFNIGSFDFSVFTSFKSL